MKVSPEKFVTIWMDSESREEVARRTGLTVKTVIRYGWTYRSNGVQLKKLAEERKGADWEELSRLCDALQQSKEQV